MTDIREKVARAICTQNLVSTGQPTEDGTVDAYWKSFIPEADGAVGVEGYRIAVANAGGVGSVAIAILASVMSPA
mgnify:CR=1 FL=1